MEYNGQQPKPIHVKLKPAELLNVAIIGAQRNILNTKAGRPRTYGLQEGNEWQFHIDGAIAEYVIAKQLGIFWNGDVGIVAAPDVTIKGGIPIEVRSTPLRSNRLIIHPDDHDERPYVLVAGTGFDRWIQGWAYAEDCKKEEYWEDPQKRDRWAYFAPLETLFKWDDLLVVVNVA